MNRISRYEPLTFIQQINKLLNEANQSWLSSSDASSVDTSQWVPAVDIKEEKDRFIILADLPGIDKNNVHISMEHNILSIKGERASESKEQQNGFSRVERVRGTFYRRFTLPDSADGDKIQANMNKGVLEILIPKKERAQSRLIEIKEQQ